MALMEPLLIGEASRHRTGLIDLALDLAQRSAGFHRSLPASMLTSLADLVRTMNCYYSNIIEGHATHPVDIARVLKGRRVVVDESIREVHRRFCEHLPAGLLSVEDPTTKEQLQQ